MVEVIKILELDMQSSGRIYHFTICNYRCYQVGNAFEQEKPEASESKY